MLPEDRLDSLLTPVLRGGLRPPENGDELAPLVDVAHRLSRLSQVSPAPEFATALHDELLRRTAQLRDQRAFATEALPLVSGAKSDGATSPMPAISASRRLRPSRSRLFWQGIAAAVVLFACGGTLSVAAFAQPGSPLYALHRLEQQIGVPGVQSDADLARQQLRDADTALTALANVVSQHGSDAAYARALATLRRDESAAATTVNSVTSSDRATLLAQLQSLQTRESAELRGALPQLGWDNRVATTLALGDLGEAIPHITSVSANIAQGNAQRSDWRIVIHGDGFEPGAALVVDGVQVGTIISQTDQTIVATVPDAALQGQPHSIGVLNPDGLAAEFKQGSAQNGNSGHATPGAATTPSPNDNHNGGHGGPPTPSR